MQQWITDKQRFCFRQRPAKRQHVLAARCGERRLPRLAILVLVLVFALHVETSPALAELASIPVGAASVDITPAYPVRLSGYGNRRTESEGVEQRIWAKALAIGSDSDGPVVLITVDNCGVPASVSDEVASRLKKRVGVVRERVAICSSHTHTAPMLTGVLPLLYAMPIPAEQQKRIDRYTRQLIEHLEQVALTALSNRQPSHIDWAVGKATFAINRRTRGGAVDHALPMLRVTTTDGKLRAILVRYSCHCTTVFGQFNRICGDWAGYAQEAIQRNHPGAIALVAIGCGADAKPRLQTQLDHARQHGLEIAQEVERLLGGQLRPIHGRLTARMEQIDLPFAPLPTREEWIERSRSKHAATAYHAKIQLERLQRGEQLATTLSYPVQTWTFGDDLAMVFLAGEVVVDYALRLQREFDGSRLWINAYSNDVPCYIASQRVLKEGGYEADRSMVYYDRPTRLAPSVEDLIVDAVQRQLPAHFYSQEKQVEYPPARSPADSLATFRTHAGLQVELVAAEPLVVDPVAIDFGVDGRLWVVEYLDYPTGTDRNYKPGGRIKYLEDIDDDGCFDKATVFLEDLAFPMGVMEWRGGVLVATAPDIVYAKDTNGDGQADVRKVVFTGFGTDNYQARVNGFRYGLDNWVHGSSGLRGGTVQSRLSNEQVELGSRDFRMNPDSGQIQAVAGGSQYGRIRDDWGNWFGNTNSNLLFHYPLPDHYLNRNRHVAAPAARVFVPGGGIDSNRLFPISRTLTRFNNPVHFNRVTSACSPMIYRGQLLGAEFAGDAFVCEPAHNLVTRLKLQRRGVTFAGTRADDERHVEFLASSDNWFRPAQVRTGPEGALWVVDIYRFVIEHPRWIGPDRLAKLNVRAGDDRGRIYRVVPQAVKLPTSARLNQLPTAQLVAALDVPNGARRDLVHRELVHRQDQAAVEPLRQMVRHGNWPAARLQALCALDGLAALSDSLLINALADSNAHVRRHAIRLSESRLASQPALAQAVLGLASDPDAGVRCQLALSLGEWKDVRAGQALAQIAKPDHDDPYVTAAVLSSAGPHLEPLLLAIMPKHGEQTPPARLLEGLVVTAAAEGDETALIRILNRIAAADIRSGEQWKFETLASLLDILQRRKTSLARLQAKASEPLRAAIAQLEPTFAIAQAVVQDANLPQALRRAAVGLLGRADERSDDDLAVLAELLSPNISPTLQSGAVAALGRMEDSRVPAVLLDAWRSYGPSLRAEILDVLFRRSAWLTTLLDRIDEGRIPHSDIDATHRQMLLTHQENRIRQRAGELLGAVLNPDRQKVLDKYRVALQLTGQSEHGQQAFTKNCATCHRFRDQGHDVGPNLDTLTERSPSALLTAILNPNQAVEPKYLGYVAATADGRVLTGRLMDETANSITLRGPEGKEHVILRTELDELVSSGKSLMPEGLEQDLQPRDVADIIAYLATAGPPRKTFAGNWPQPIVADADGVFKMLPQNAEIYGSTLTQAKHMRVVSLTQWRSKDDHAVWRLEVVKPGRYEVWLDWMCDEDAAGNVFVLHLDECDQPALTGIATKTVAEDNWYRTKKVGELTLAAGPQVVTLRSADQITGSLFHLRALTLIPASR